MSRSIKGSKCCSYEYWSKRPYSQSSPGRESKKLTLRCERRIAKHEIADQVKDDDSEFCTSEAIKIADEINIARQSVTIEFHHTHFEYVIRINGEFVDYWDHNILDRIVPLYPLAG